MNRVFVFKTAETLGTVAGIAGALLVANKMGQHGYPLFLASSACLLGTAIAEKNKNYIVLQAVYFCTNVLGFVNYVL